MFLKKNIKTNLIDGTMCALNYLTILRNAMLPFAYEKDHQLYQFMASYLHSNWVDQLQWSKYNKVSNANI